MGQKPVLIMCENCMCEILPLRLNKEAQSEKTQPRRRVHSSLLIQIVGSSDF